jgi:hypothetical protein
MKEDDFSTGRARKKRRDGRKAISQLRDELVDAMEAK